MQRSDDAGRNLRGVWLGPENAFRWPFDATFTEWGVGFALFWPAFVVLWLVLPVGVLLIAGSLLASTWIARYGSIGLGSQQVRRRTWLTAILLLNAALWPSVGAWLLPMTWWMAAPGAVVASACLVRAARPHLDGNRPLAYWLKALQDIASGPRPLRPELWINPEGFTIIDGHDTELGDELWEFMLSINNADPEGVPMRLYRQRTPEVQAVLWDTGSGDEKTGSMVIAWLRAKGLPVVVHSVDYRQDGNGVQRLRSADVELDGVTLPQKCVIFVHSDAPRIWGTRTAEQFGIEFEAVHLATPAE